MCEKLCQARPKLPKNPHRHCGGHSIFLKETSTTGENLPKGPKMRFAGLRGHYCLLMWRTNINSPVGVK